MRDADQFSGDLLRVQPRRADDARHDAKLGLGREECLGTAAATVFKGADGLGILIGAVVVFLLAGRHADNDGQGIGLLVDGIQRGGKCAFRACLADSFGQVADEDGLIFREYGRVGVFAGRHQADDGGADGA